MHGTGVSLHCFPHPLFSIRHLSLALLRLFNRGDILIFRYYKVIDLLAVFFLCWYAAIEPYAFFSFGAFIVYEDVVEIGVEENLVYLIHDKVIPGLISCRIAKSIEYATDHEEVADRLPKEPQEQPYDKKQARLTIDFYDPGIGFFAKETHVEEAGIYDARGQAEAFEIKNRRVTPNFPPTEKGTIGKPAKENVPSRIFQPKSAVAIISSMAEKWHGRSGTVKYKGQGKQKHQNGNAGRKREISLAKILSDEDFEHQPGIRGEPCRQIIDRRF